MKPSKEAIDSCYSKIFHAAWESWRVDITNGLEAAYAIDVAPLEARVKKLEADIRSCSAWSAHLQMDLETSGEIIKKLEAENRGLSGQVADLSIALGKEKAENQRLKAQLEGR